MWIFASVVLVLTVISPGFRKVAGWVAMVIGLLVFFAVVRS
jgi:hypothetical protein